MPIIRYTLIAVAMLTTLLAPLWAENVGNTTNQSFNKAKRIFLKQV